jgi:hypothetical protein
MICIAYGYEKYMQQLDPNKQMVGEEIYSFLSYFSNPLWLHMDGRFIQLTCESQIKLACNVVAEYHNMYTYNHLEDDNWHAETQYMEEQARRHMEEPDSESETEEGGITE